MVQTGLIPIIVIMQMCLTEIGLFLSETIYQKVVSTPVHPVPYGSE